jgi:hypothetical protein
MKLKTNVKAGSCNGGNTNQDNDSVNQNGVLNIGIGDLL